MKLSLLLAAAFSAAALDVSPAVSSDAVQAGDQMYPGNVLVTMNARAETKVNVGTVTGEKLHDMVYMALMRLCQPAVRAKECKHNLPVDIDVTCVDSRGVVSDCKIQLEVHGSDYSFHNGIDSNMDADRLREALIRTVANVIKIQSMQPKNSRLVKLQSNQPGEPYEARVFNVGSQLRVEVEENEKFTQGHFILIGLSGIDNEGPFDCYSSETDISNYLDGTILKEYRKAYSMSDRELGGIPSCLPHRRYVPWHGGERSLGAETPLELTTAPSLDAEKVQQPNMTSHMAQHRHIELRMPPCNKDRCNKVNVGKLTGQELYNSIYAALDNLCPVKAGRCRESERVAIDTIYVENDLIIESKIEIFVTMSNYAAGNGVDGPGLRSLMIRTVAETLKRQTEEKRNCRTDTYRNGYRSFRPIELCNVGAEVSIVSTFHFMYVHLTGWGKRGNYDCNAAQPSVDAYMKSVIHDYALALDLVWKEPMGETYSYEATCRSV